MSVAGEHIGRNEALEPDMLLLFFFTNSVVAVHASVLQTIPSLVLDPDEVWKESSGSRIESGVICPSSNS